MFAKEIWDELWRKFGTLTMMHTVVHLREVTTTTKKNDMPMQEYLAKIQETNQKVRKGGVRFTDQVLAYFMLLGLPKEYAPWKITRIT